MAASSGGSSAYRQVRQQEAKFLTTMQNQGSEIAKYAKSLKDAGIVSSNHELPFHREAVDAEIHRLSEIKQKSKTELETIQNEIQSLDLPHRPVPPDSEDVSEMVDQIIRACDEEAVLKELLKRMPSLPLPLEMESYDTRVREVHTMHLSLTEKANALESSQAELSECLQQLRNSMLERLPSEAQVKEWKDLGERAQSLEQTMANQLQRFQELEPRVRAAERQIEDLVIIRRRLTHADEKIQTQRQEISRLGNVDAALTAARNEVAFAQGTEKKLQTHFDALDRKLSLQSTETEQITASLIAERERTRKLRQEVDVLRSSYLEVRGLNSQLESNLRQVRWECSDLEERLLIANSRIGCLVCEKSQAKLEFEAAEDASKEIHSELHLRLEKLQVDNNDQTDEISSLQRMRDILSSEVHLMLLAQDAMEAMFTNEIDSRDAMIRYHEGRSDELEEQLDTARSRSESLNLEIGAEQKSTQDLQRQLETSQTRLADLESAVISGRLHSDCRKRYSLLLLLREQAECEASRLDGIHFQQTYQMAALRREVRELELRLEDSNILLVSQSERTQHLCQEKRKTELRHQQSTENIEMILGAVLSVDISPLSFSIESIAQISRTLVGEQIEYAASNAWVAEFSCLTNDNVQIDDWHMLRCFLEMKILSFDELRAVVSHLDSHGKRYRDWTVSIMLAFLEHTSDVTVSQLSVADAVAVLSLFDLVNRYLQGTSLSDRIASFYNQLLRNLAGAIESSPLVGGLADWVSEALSGSRQPLCRFISRCAAHRQVSMSKDGIELILDQKRLILLSECADEHSLTLIWPGQYQLVTGIFLVLRIFGENHEELRSFAWDITKDRSGATMAGRLFRHTLRHLSQGTVGKGFHT